MDRFIRCLCEEDYEALIIEGTADKQTLSNQWTLFLSDYFELRGDTVTTVEHIRIKRDIIRLQSHLYSVEECIWFLKDKYSDTVAECLRLLGYSFNPEDKNPQNYYPLLVIISNKSRNKYVQLQQQVKELDRMLSTLSNEKPSKKQFENALIQIEEMQKTTYRMEELTVSKYLLLEKKYNAMVERLNKQH